jgi:broad specificity phosphatase PhoE
VRIVALRHLPTRANRDGVLLGTRDGEIEPPDSAMMARVAEQGLEIAALGPFGRVLVSDLRRTMQTAKLYGFSLPVVEPLLRELNFGEFEGRPKDELDRRFGAVWHDDPRNLALGETMAAFEARIKAAMEKHGGSGSLLIFGHGAWLRGLRSIVRNGDIRAMNHEKLENNELVVLDTGKS